jgi:hypothetical protein
MERRSESAPYSNVAWNVQNLMRERYQIAVFVAVHPDDGYWNSRNMLLWILFTKYMLRWRTNCCFEGLHSVHFRILDISSIHHPGAHYTYNTNLHHSFPGCFGVSHTIFRETLRVPFSKPLLLQSSCPLHWLCHKIWNVQLCWFVVFWQWLK